MMRMQPVAFLISFLCLVFMASTACAADYKDWISLLPDRIDGLGQSGDPDGMNVQSEGQSWSTLEQGYADGSGEKEIKLTIVSGSMAPQVKQFQAMKQFSMEDEEKVVETLEISGNDAVMELYKDGGKGNLLIAPQQKTIVIIQATSADNKEELVSLADDVPLSDIAAAIE